MIRPCQLEWSFRISLLMSRNLESEDEGVYVVLESLGGRRVGQWMRYDLRHWTLQKWKRGQSCLR